MAILTSFTILFKTNAKESTKDIEQLNKALNNLNKGNSELNELISQRADKNLITINQNNLLFKQEVANQQNIKITSRALKNKNSNLLKTLSLVKNLAFGFLSLRMFSSAFSNEFNANTSLESFSQSLEINAKDVDAWADVLAKAMGSKSKGMEEAKKNLSTLKHELWNMAHGGGQKLASTLGFFGITARDALGNMKDPSAILLEIHDAYQKMDKAQKMHARSIMEEAGFSDAMTTELFKNTSLKESLAKYRELSGATDEHMQKVKELNSQFIEVGLQIDKLIDKIYDKLISPLFLNFGKNLESGVKNLNEMFDENPEGFYALMGGAGAGAYGAYRYGKKYIKDKLGKDVDPKDAVKKGRPPKTISASEVEVTAGKKVATAEAEAVVEAQVAKKTKMQITKELGGKYLSKLLERQAVAGGAELIPVYGQILAALISAYTAVELGKDIYETFTSDDEEKKKGKPEDQQNDKPRLGDNFSFLRSDPLKTNYMQTIGHAPAHVTNIATVNVHVDAPIIQAQNMSPNQLNESISTYLQDNIKDHIYKIADGRIS